MLLLLEHNLAKLLLIIFLFLFPATIYQHSENSEEHKLFLKLYQESFFKGGEFLNKGEFQRAIKSYELSLDLAKKYNDSRKQVKSWLKLGLLYWNTGELDISFSFYSKAQSVAKQFGYLSEYSTCTNAIEIYRLYKMGKENRGLNYYEASIANFQIAIKIARENKFEYHELKCLRQLSISHWENNELNKFFYLNQKCMLISKKLKHRREIGKAYNNIGLYYWKRNNYSKALSFYQEALFIARSFESQAEVAASLNNIANVLQHLGFQNRAIEYLLYTAP